MQRKWILPRATDMRSLDSVQSTFGLPACFVSLLLQRGLTGTASVESFLYPKLRSLSAPELLPDMSPAVERVDIAMRNGEKIVLYGDYDVDGIASLALISRILAAYRIRAECFLPRRTEEGYGLTLAGIKRCFAEHRPDLLIAVDCGTNSAEEVAAVRRRGADVVILDHHEVHSRHPNCTALVNPKMGRDFHYLCSAGVAFKLAHALVKYHTIPGINLKDYLDIVALATVADLVPLIGENRTLVKWGLKQMRTTRWAGLAALTQIAGVKASICSADIGFRLGPRINAAGRLGTAHQALALLLSDDPEECIRLATDLNTRNCERQTVEKSVTREVEFWIEAHHDHTRNAAIIAGHQNWHSGVLGIVASRIARRYHRPTLIIGFDGSGVGKGSGRSIEGFPLIKALRRCSNKLEGFGGHRMAAGLTLLEANFKSFCTSFEEVAKSLITEEMLIPRLYLDAEVSAESLSHSLLEWQDQLEPFGSSNPQPLFLLRQLQPVHSPHWMGNKQHLSLKLSSGRRQLEAVFFNAVGFCMPHPPWDVAFHLDRNEFSKHPSFQLRIIDIRSSKGSL
ncbi:Single-stranded-DNA-specific exonuclease RecJ [Candidatus Xiphinematobacter sp. Idaho Grape]|nr:Single-stranded-DNA-specific exonuclease RecJ [Candidatus Xiphinematobacter sp. Idaho Grape]